MGLRDRIAGEAGAARSNGDDGDGVAYWRQRLLEEVDLDEIAVLSVGQRRARLEKVTGLLISAGRGRSCRPPRGSRLIRRVVDEALGLGVLEPLLADETITEIMVNGPADI